MPAKKKATGTAGLAGRSGVTAALRKTTAKKTVAKKSTAKASAAATDSGPGKKTAAAKKTGAAKKAAAAKTAPVKKAAAKKAAPAKSPAKAAAKKTAVAKKSAATKATAKKSAPAAKKAAVAAPGKARRLRVRDDESPWTAKELADVRAELEGDVARLSSELSGFEDDIAGLIKDSGDGAGDDDADTGAKTFEREHEASLAQNSRDLLEQSVHALKRIDDGTYGVCENCGNAIGKLRLQAFPRATLCLTCKAQQERR